MSEQPLHQEPVNLAPLRRWKGKRRKNFEQQREPRNWRSPAPGFPLASMPTTTRFKIDIAKEQQTRKSRYNLNVGSFGTFEYQPAEISQIGINLTTRVAS